MSEVEQIFLWIGGNFSTESYMFHSKIQVILWSAADIILVLAILRIVELGRRKLGMKGPLVRYVLLCLTAVLTPFLLFSRTTREFFLLECIICGSQFLILLYTVVVERKRLLDLVLRSISDSSPSPSVAPRKSTDLR